jgi:hypothetical protein
MILDYSSTPSGVHVELPDSALLHRQYTEAFLFTKNNWGEPELASSPGTPDLMITFMYGQSKCLIKMKLDRTSTPNAQTPIHQFL